MFQTLKRFFISIVSLVLFLSPHTFALACGMMFAFDPYTDRLDYIMENEHQVYINYENGVEKLLVAIKADNLQGKQAVWLFPIPSVPERISLDVLTTIPSFEGEDVSINAKDTLEDIESGLQNTQLYPAFFNAFFGMSSADLMLPNNSMPTLGAMPGGHAMEPDIVVHAQIAKEGITSQIITARTADALFGYLKEKGMAIEQGTIPVLNTYIGSEFSFIVSWVTSTNDGPGIAPQKGFFVTFPTERIYYPLMPEQVYGEMVMPLSIRVVGHVTPEIPASIKPYTDITYFIDDAAWDNTQGENGAFFGSPRERLRYTRIDLDAPSNLFTEDLWMNTKTPLKIIAGVFITDHPVVTGLLILLYTSVLASIAAGLLLFANKRSLNDATAFGFVGVANCLTILGFIIATIFIQTTETSPAPPADPNQPPAPQQKPSFLQQRIDARKLAYIPVFSMLFLALVWGTIRVLSLSF